MVGVGLLDLDVVAVAEAQVHDGRARDAFQRPVDPGDCEFLRLRDEGFHERLVELNDVGAGFLQVARSSFTAFA